MQKTQKTLVRIPDMREADYLLIMRALEIFTLNHPAYGTIQELLIDENIMNTHEVEEIADIFYTLEVFL